MHEVCLLNASGSGGSSCSPAVWSQPVAQGEGHYQHREMQHLPQTMLQQRQKSAGNKREVCNTMKSHSLIHQMPETKSTQQNGQGASEKKGCFCAQCLFSWWNCLHEIHIKDKSGSNNTKDKPMCLDLDAAFSL